MTSLTNIEVGDIYLVPNQKYTEIHYHIVILINTLGSELIVVPLNSYEKLNKRFQDNRCILEINEIPNLITKRTQVTFRKSFLISLTDLISFLENGDAKFKAKAPPEVIEKIQMKLVGSNAPFEVQELYINNKMYPS